MHGLEGAIRVLIPLGCALAGVGLVGRGLPKLMNTPSLLAALRDLLVRISGVFLGCIVAGALCLLTAASLYCVRAFS